MRSPKLLSPAARAVLTLTLTSSLLACGGGGGSAAPANPGTGTTPPGTSETPVTPPAPAPVVATSLSLSAAGHADTPAISLLAPGELSLAVTTQFSDGSNAAAQDVTWQGLDEAVAQFVTPGVLKAVGPGQITLIARAGALTSNPLTVTVRAPALQSMTLQSVAPLMPLVPQGHTRLQATGDFEQGHSADISEQVTWYSLPTGIVQIDADGFVTALKAGTATVYAESGAVRSPELTLTVQNLPPTLTALHIARGGNDAAAALYPGQTARYSALGDYTTGPGQTPDRVDVSRTVSWSVSPPDRARISADGVLTALAAGRVTVRASLDGINSATLDADVVAAPVTLTGLTLNAGANAFSLQVGQPVDLAVRARYSDQSENDVTPLVSWTSSNPAVIQINAAGQPEAIGPGTATLQAVRDGQSSNAVTVTVNTPPAQAYSVQTYTADSETIDKRSNLATVQSNGQQVVQAASGRLGQPYLLKVSDTGISADLVPKTSAASNIETTITQMGSVHHVDGWHGVSGFAGFIGRFVRDTTEENAEEEPLDLFMGWNNPKRPTTDGVYAGEVIYIDAPNDTTARRGTLTITLKDGQIATEMKLARGRITFVNHAKDDRALHGVSSASARLIPTSSTSYISEAEMTVDFHGSDGQFATGSVSRSEQGAWAGVFSLKRVN